MRLLGLCAQMYLRIMQHIVDLLGGRDSPIIQRQMLCFSGRPQGMGITVVVPDDPYGKPGSQRWDWAQEKKAAE